ncbi:MAG: ABC transporter substrate-binding protein [Lachnospiraceae bacterium]|nr:ABC transporter substrate-binding protein [Lachnospiraceae bacterium]
MKKLIYLILVTLILTACSGNNNDILSEENSLTPDKREVLTLGFLSANSSVLRELSLSIKTSNFNEFNHRYRVELKEYEDADKLNMDIATGKSPDIILLPSGFMLDVHAEKGAIIDLYPLLDNDRHLKRADLQEHILKTYEINGQLFTMPLYYTILTMAAARSELGETDSWTLDEMIAYANQKLPESHVFYNHSKTVVLEVCLYANLESLIGWDSGGLFDRAMFLKILNFANQFTADDLFNLADPFNQIKDGVVQLQSWPISSTMVLQWIQFNFDAPVTLIGLPTQQGSGNIAQSDALLAISQSSKNKEEAWSFISYLLTEENQIFDFIPIRKSAFEIHISKFRGGTVTNRWSDIVFESYPATEEEMLQFRNLVLSVTKSQSRHEKASDILREEAQSFFSGAKSAEEAADVAADRIAVYLSELW